MLRFYRENDVFAGEHTIRDLNYRGLQVFRPNISIVSNKLCMRRALKKLIFHQCRCLVFFEANLKMDRRATAGVRSERIGCLVAELGMGEFANTTLSLLSGGERKKVALAVQLLNDPPILFCDEITTGLDSYTAAHIVDVLKRIARTGKIVVCTIHQPASGVFDKFDDVVLLSDGRLAYQGSVTMVNQLFQK